MNPTATLRQLYDAHPYPINPLEMSPKEDINLLFLHSLTTAHYVRGDGYVKSQGKLILDVGCGSGYGALVMAIANPGAKVVGIDLSPKSIEVARERLQFHGITNCEFHALSIEELPSLGLQFDYINCDEVLYMLPDPVRGLQIMASVLSTQGIIRTNLHSIHQRREFYRAQDLSHFLGLMDGSIGDWECDVIRELMMVLKDGVRIKEIGWAGVKEGNEGIRMNFFLVGDKGFTIPAVFEMMESSQLEMISMVNWTQWNLEELFQASKALPEYVEMIMSEATTMQKLHLFELLHPIHRLLDFWCGHQNREILNHQPHLSQFTYSDSAVWQASTVHLHPLLRTEKFKEALEEAIAQSMPFRITQFLSCTSAQPVNLSTPSTICLWLLWQQPRSIDEIVKYWLSIKPLNHLTLAAVTESEAFDEIHQVLIYLETLVVVLVES
jgi:SAM-dependent methyltransferase